MKWKEFLKPNKEKIILAPIIIIIWYAIKLLIIYASGGIALPFRLTGGLVIELIIYYPFACAIYWFFKTRKGKKDKNLSSKIIISAIIFNPVTINIILVTLLILLVIGG